MGFVNRPTSIDIPLLTLVTRVDPEWNRAKHRELQYDFSPRGRRFFVDPYNEGAYAQGAFDASFDASFDGPFSDR